MPTGVNKAIAGAGGVAGGVGIGSAIATLILAIWWPNATSDVAVAVTTICNAVVGVVSTFAAVYAVPHNG